MKRQIVAAILGFCILETTALEIVKDGKPLAEIVLAENSNASRKAAAADLRKYIQAISGAELQIVNTPTGKYRNKIYIGESRFTQGIGFSPAKFKSSGYQIFVKGNVAVLTGKERLSQKNPYKTGNRKKDLEKWREFTGEPFTLMQVNNGAGTFCQNLDLFPTDDTGSWYAVSALLEQLGVRFYAPYEDGTVIPSSKTILLKDQDTRVEAAFGRRHWTAHVRDVEGIQWLKRSRAGVDAPIEFNHMQYAILTSPEFRAKYPQFYAQETPGKFYEGYPAGTGMPRLTDPEYRKKSTQLAQKVFDAFPHLKGLCMGIPDGGLRLDYRDVGLYKGDLEQQGSNILWDYTVAIAKEIRKTHPGKYLIYMPYGGCRKVPTNKKPDDPDNIILGYPVSYSAYRVENSLDQIMFNNLKKWQAFLKPSTRNILWDYFLYYRTKARTRYPVFFTKYLQSEMQRLRPYVDGKFIEIPMEVHSNGISLKKPEGFRIGESFATSLMMYWQNRLFWNPDEDREAMLNEYYKLFFGPAEKEMKEFHEFAEMVWSRQESRSVTPTTGFLKQDDLPKYFDLLNRALAKTEKDSVYHRRIEKLIRAYSPIKNLFENLKRTGPTIRGCTLDKNAPLDGNPGKYRSGWYNLRYKDGRFPEYNHTTFKIGLTKDGKYLYLLVCAYENKMHQIKMVATQNDKTEIFDDDLVEFYLNTPQRSYFKICVNPAGTRWDESTDTQIINRDTLPILWNPNIQVWTRREADRWLVELKIPTDDFGGALPTKVQPWGIQVARTRMLPGGKQEWFSLGCGPSGYASIPQWGNLWMR